MNKMKKLLSVVLAVVLAFSALSVLGSAAKTAYKTVDELTALDAYSPYGQVTRLSTEERTSIIFDALDNMLPGLNINMGEVFNVLGLSVTIDFTSVDRICYSLDTIKNTFTNTLASIAMAIVNLGILESLEVGTWATGMSRDGTAQFTIISEVIEFLSANTTLVGKVFTDGLDLGLVSLGDMSAIEDIIMNLPGMIKGLVYPMIERWDDTLYDVQRYDNSIAGTGDNVEAIANDRIKALFTDDMSITTIKYDVNGNMTSEHTNWLATATGSAAPGTPSTDSPRCYYQFSSTTPGSVMTVYHIVDAAEAEALAEDNNDDNNQAAYTYFKEEQTFVMTQEVEGSATYVWRATDAWNNTWSLKWYNDESQFLPGFDGTQIDLANQSLADLLYMFIPDVFANMAPVVLNGSVKKILAEFLGAKFNYVGDVGSDAVNALADSSNTFFTEEQGEYLWEWSNYAVINGNHYYRFEDQIFAGDLSQKNNYFDIINWDYEITGDFLNEFIPTAPSASSTLLMNLNNFIIKVAKLALKETAETVDTISGFEATWTRPALTEGGNENLVANLKAVAQAVIGLAPQHVFGSDYATNERCYVELMLSDDDDTVLTGIAAHIVNMVMPSMSLPGKSAIVASNAKVGAILAAVIREFAAYLAPEYNYDALIYTDFGTTTADPNKTFVDPETAGLLTAGQTASGYWLDVCLTMGMDIGYEYLRAFADLGEDTALWAGAVNAGYDADGKTYAAGTTQAALNAQWEGMLDYIVDFALSSEAEWAWRFEKLVNTSGLTISLGTIEDPWVKLDQILDSLLPVDEILNVTATDCETELEQLLRYNLILAIVDLRWDDLADMLKVPNGFVRNANVLDSLATVLKNLVNGIFAKIGNSSDNFEFIPSVITDFDTLANQDNLVTMVKNIVGALYNALVTDGGCDVLFPFLNFLLGWKTDPQVIADPQIWSSFRDGNDYAFQWNPNTSAITAVGEAINATYIKILNNSAGMLETHRDSSVTDHAYEINIRSITADGTTNNDISFTYDSVISPYETIDVEVTGTYKGEEAITMTIEYDYVGKDGQPVGGTQYTTYTFLLSNQYEDANVDGRFDGDDDEDYTGIPQYKKFQFTEDIYATVTGYEQQVFFVKPTVDLSGTTSKSFSYVHAPDWSGSDCNGNATGYIDMTGNAATYFDYNDTKEKAGWEDSVSDGNPAYGFLYAPASGVTAETFSEENSEANNLYGTYDMGQYCIKYGNGEKKINIDFIYYNSYGIYDIYMDNKDRGVNPGDVDDAAVYAEWNAAFKDIVKYATYPMMTEANGNAATDYVATIQPLIPAAIERFEAADEALANAMGNAAGGADAEIPSYVKELEAQLALDDGDGENEVNFQDYEFYEYFNYADLRTAHRNFVKTYYAPEIMDTYYILNSGIREAELNNVIAAEDNAAIAAGIAASRLENSAEDIAASVTARADWKMPVDSELLVDDMTARLAYYKTFLTGKEEPNSHLYFLNQEIAHIDAQQLVEDDYTADSWAKFQEEYEDAQAVVAGTAEYSNCNSVIYEAKWNLMVAYKNLLEKSRSLIEAGGTADLMANRAIADEIFASLDAQDGAWVVKEGVDADTAYAALISALGYYYTGEDGNEWNLYADSALEYIDNDRPNNQNNQAKVNTSNAALEAAIANFEAAAEEMEPSTLMVEEGFEYADYVVIDTNNNNYGEYTGIVYGIDTLDQNEMMEVLGALDDALTTNNGDDYLVIEANENGNESTGAVITVVDENGDALETYVFIYFGDIDGDAMISTNDAFIAEYYEGTYEGIETYAQYVSADIDGDGMPSANDAYIMEYYEGTYEGVDYQYNLGQNAMNNTYEWIF